jgi:translation initiation factor IF-2
LQLTEFISVSELANLMDVSFAEVIGKCMGLGIMVSINQRLDAEVIELVAGEFGFDVEFIDMEKQMEMEEDDDEDEEGELLPRSPIVTIMGHVDHGKTSLLDYIRSANVVAGEAGGITQHIGAYKVAIANGKEITFLDTPGHEAFTAMRARGAKVTDIAVIVVAADDAVMPQTKEAISHAQAAGVPMIFAINKIDKDGANSQKIYEQLSQMNILVEAWGGKFQSQELSAKQGLNVDLLLEKILLEAEILDLKANPEREATGTIIEATLDKGRGYVATVLVQNGTLKAGDLVVCGQYFGRVKAMFNERNKKEEEAGPSAPVLILGLNGAPQAGEKFKVYEDESEAKEIAYRRAQILREQGIRTKKHITLDEIGRRLALGNFKELNVIIKGDVDGSVEALSDSLQKLSTQEIVIRVIHKAVGQITESDITLANASDAIVIGFNVRPSMQAARLAEQEAIEIKNYSIIYNAIEEIKSAMEGMLEPTVQEKIVANVEIREVYKFDKAVVAGCYVLEGKLKRDAKIRLIRDGIVVYPTGEGASAELQSLKRYKDDAKEVVSNMECGLTIKNYQDIKVGDIVEAYEQEEIKRTL